MPLGCTTKNSTDNFRRRFYLSFFLIFCLFLTAFLLTGHYQKLVVYNATPSVPEGFYRYAGQEAGIGQIILFKTPPIVLDYTARYFNAKPVPHFLKPVVAGEGDHVCFQDGSFYVNGKLLNAVQDRDSSGNALPVWKECRDLKDGEYFVYSARVKNSFDSRYYGPVGKNDVVGVFKSVF